MVDAGTPGASSGCSRRRVRARTTYLVIETTLVGPRRSSTTVRGMSDSRRELARAATGADGHNDRRSGEPRRPLARPDARATHECTPGPTLGERLARLWLAMRAIVLFAFGVFFVVPLAWLALAPTKTDPELLTRNPLAVGTLHNVWVAWQQSRWIRRSDLPALAGELASVLADCDCDQSGDRDPCRLRASHRQIPGAEADPEADARRDTHAGGVTCAPGLPGVERGRTGRQRLLDHLAVRVLPFWRLSRVHLLRDRDSAGAHGCSADRRLQRVGRVSSHGIPLAKPVLALVFFFSFVADWNNFFLPFAILSNERQLPIQVGLSDLFSSTRPAVALATLVAAMPVAIVFVASQRALVRGLVGGATKE